MKVRISLYASLLLWSLINLAILGGILTVLLNLRFQPGPHSILTGDAGNRLRGIAFLISRDLQELPQEKWERTLNRFSEAYKVDFALYSPESRRVAGRIYNLPEGIAQEIRTRSEVLHSRPAHIPQESLPPAGGGSEPLGPQNGARSSEIPPGTAPPARWTEEGPMPPIDRLPGSNPPPNVGPFPGPAPIIFMARSDSPEYYWAGLFIPVPRSEKVPGGMLVFLIRSSSPSGNGLFPEPFPWGTLSLVILTLSALLWFPLVRYVTRPLSHMTKATERIACGHFDIRLDERRSDEIGRLGRSINDMAARLDRHVRGQRRFLSDVAHELSSPLARIEIGLGLLENADPPPDPKRLQDVREDARHLSELVSELLSYSRAEANPARVRLVPVGVESAIQRAVDRECQSGVDIQSSVEPGLQALADPELLTRAIANLVRNAVRYAGNAGPILVDGRKEGQDVTITVRDQGPGVPEESLGRLFEPFYRPELARGSESGGAGLGLAIVHTCVTACRGTATCRNRKPQGFEVILRLSPPKNHSDSQIDTLNF